MSHPGITLSRIDDDLIRFYGEMHRKRSDYGNINNKLNLLFCTFSDNTCRDDVRIKVATLNTIYQTSIIYIDPVVDKIVEIYSREDIRNKSSAEIVDLIAIAEWKSRSGKEIKRNNMSFASKFVHFESKYEIPIYDSYVWIVMTGYLIQNGIGVSFSSPRNYSEFHERYRMFTKRFGLECCEIYNIDKFLWLYGSQLLAEIQEKAKVGLSRAKTILKERLKK